MAESNTNRIEIVNHYYTGDRPQARLSYTFPAGTKLAGIRLVEGEIQEHPEHGTVVHFDAYRNREALKGTAVAKGKHVDAVVAGKPDLEALVAEARELVAAEESRIAAEASALAPIGYLYANGCDASDTHRVLWPDGSDQSAVTIAEKGWPIEIVKRHVKSDELKAIAEETSAEVVAPTMSTWGGYRFGPEGLARIFALARERADAAAAKKGAADAAAASRVAAAVAKARETGKPEVVDHWMEDCNDAREECSQDSCMRLAMPDGTFKVVRQHTW